MFPVPSLCAIIVVGDYEGRSKCIQFIQIDKPLDHGLIYIGGNTTCQNGYICSKKAMPI